MIHAVAVGIGALLILVTLAGFLLSFWRQTPKGDNSSRSDWASLTGGGFPPDHHNPSDHGGTP
jgi:hypothetical protein